MDTGVDTVLDAAFHAAKHELIAEHLEQEVAREPWVQTVEYDASIPRWYVRFGCEGRDAATIYFDLHQRTLRYELYFMPDPPANHEALYRFLLQCSHAMYGAHFSIGPDGDCYLVGRTLLEHLDVRRARPHHRRALRSGRAVVPGRHPHRLRPPLTPAAEITSDCRKVS